MPVTYAIKKVKNPNGQDGVDYFHGRVIKTGDYNFEDLVEDINNSTTVTQADALAVLRSMKSFITKALLAGQRVVLNDLGSLQIGLRGKCYPAAALQDKEFVPSAMIKGHTFRFRPEVKLKNDIAAHLSIKRISSDAMA